MTLRYTSITSTRATLLTTKAIPHSIRQVVARSLGLKVCPFFAASRRRLGVGISVFDELDISVLASRNQPVAHPALDQAPKAQHHRASGCRKTAATPTTRWRF